MTSIKPNVRERGAGPAVICLHANASSSAQWRPLMNLLSDAYRVVAPDCYGSGTSPDWPSDQRIRLKDEVDLVAPVLADASPASVVGHSFGGAIALMAALVAPQRVRALALYEPTLFSVVDQLHPQPNGVEGIRNAVAAAAAAAEIGDHDQAAEHFIDYWMGTGSWRATPAERKPALMESIRNVRRWAHALFTETTRLQAFAELDIPILYMVGTQSPQSAHAVADALVPVLRRANLDELDGLGHMGPITHPDVVNAQIAAFLRDTAAKE